MLDPKEIDQKWMLKALEAALRTRPSPNPPVGAVVVSADGTLASSSAHQKAGSDHAEVIALREAGDATRGGTLYVTLEPCNHQGKTPPCVEAILASGVKRVVIGCLDPNPHVAGGGAERMAQAGILVEVGVCATAAEELIAPWAKYVTTGIPHVSLKLGLSLDGRIATRTGASKWVTGPEARAKVQELRASHDAVAVGIGTAIADDPRLTVRDQSLITLACSAPTRLIFDTHLRLPLSTRLVQHCREVPTTVMTSDEAPHDAEQALLDAGCGVIRVHKSTEGRVDVPSALRALAKLGVVSILFEGGAELAGSLLASRSVDELHAFVAPILLGPRGRPGAVDWAGPDSPMEAPRIVEPKWELCGHDAYVRGLLALPEHHG